MKKNKKERPGDSVMNISELVKFFCIYILLWFNPKESHAFVKIVD